MSDHQPIPSTSKAEIKALELALGLLTAAMWFPTTNEIEDCEPWPDCPYMAMDTMRKALAPLARFSPAIQRGIDSLYQVGEIRASRDQGQLIGQWQERLSEIRRL